MEKILDWVKKYKVQLIAGGLIVLLLAAAFWYGSGSSDSKGFSMTKKQETTSGKQEAKPDKEADGKAEVSGTVTQDAVLAGTRGPIEVLIAQAQGAEKQKISPNKNVSSDSDAAEDAGKGQNASSNKSDKIEESSQVSQPEGSQSAAANGDLNTPNNSPDTGTMVINPDTGKDQYQTDPVPAGKPEPVEPEDTEPGKKTYSCTISISCATILNNMNLLDKNKTGLIPKDGWILKPVTVFFQEGESVFDVLQQVCREKKIHMEFSNTPMYNSAYIEGISNIYEFDVGSLSGWNYKVNDWFPNYGCSRYQLKDGDVICWMYTCNLGKDVGGSNTAGR